MNKKTNNISGVRSQVGILAINKIGTKVTPAKLNIICTQVPKFSNFIRKLYKVAIVQYCVNLNPSSNLSNKTKYEKIFLNICHLPISSRLPKKKNFQKYYSFQSRLKTESSVTYEEKKKHEQHKQCEKIGRNPCSSIVMIHKQSKQIRLWLRQPKTEQLLSLHKQRSRNLKRISEWSKG